jgi:hypothetical protein
MSRREHSVARCGLAAAFLALGLALPNAALAVGITASVNRNEVVVGDRLSLTLAIDGSASGDPVLPDLSAFDVYSQGQSTQMQIVNGRMSTSVSQQYVLVPKRAGTFTIGAITMEIGGKTYSSQPFTIRVLAAEEQPRESRDLFVSAKVSKADVFVGEQLLYSLRIYQRVQLSQASLQPIEFNGFLAEDMGKEATYDATVGGVAYRVTEIKKALFPQEAGTLTIPAARLSAEVVVQKRRRGNDPFDDMFRSPFGDFFGQAGTETRNLASNEVKVEVKPLPPAPKGYSGLVGNFDLRAQLSNAQPKVGETTTLTISVTGKGNAQSIKEPELGELADFKVYDDKPVASLRQDADGVSGTRTFSKALVPLKAGPLTIPAARLVFFDTTSGRFETRSTEPLTVTAIPSDAKEELRLTELSSPNSGKVAVRVLADDILPNYGHLDAVGASFRRPAERALFGGGLLFPPFAFVLLFMVRRHRERLSGDVAFRRGRLALKKASRVRHNVERALREDHLNEAATILSRGLREYIGDRLNVEGAALTPAEAAALITEHGAHDQDVEAVRRVLRDCEAVLYGASDVTTREQVRAAKDGLGELIHHLERALE